MTRVLAEPGVTAVGVVLFIFLAAWCFTNKRVDISLALLAVYLGLADGYLKLRTGSQFVTFGRDLLVVAIAGGALMRALRSRERLPIPPLGGLVIGFGAIVVVEVFNPGGRTLAGGLAGVRQHLEFVPLFFLGYAFVRDERRLEKFLLILVICASVGGVVSYIQSTLTPEQLANWGPGYRERILGSGAFLGGGRTSVDTVTGVVSVRPFGLGSDAGAGAVIAALAFPALLALMLVGRRQLRLPMLLLAVGIALAVATSGSRAAVVTTLVSLVAFGIIAAGSRNAARVVVGLAVGTLIIYTAFGQLASSNSASQRTRSIVSSSALSTYGNERGDSLAKFGSYALAYPFGIGVGYGGPAATVFRAPGELGSFGDPTRSGSLLDYETQWNYLVLETGLAGLGAFLLLNLRLLALGFQRIRRMRDQTLRWQLAALTAPLVGLVAQGFAGLTTASAPTAPYLWFVCGVLSYWLITRSKPRAPLTVATGQEHRYSGQAAIEATVDR